MIVIPRKREIPSSELIKIKNNRQIKNQHIVFSNRTFMQHRPRLKRYRLSFLMRPILINYYIVNSVKIICVVITHGMQLVSIWIKLGMSGEARVFVSVKRFGIERVEILINFYRVTTGLNYGINFSCMRDNTRISNRIIAIYKFIFIPKCISGI